MKWEGEGGGTEGAEQREGEGVTIVRLQSGGDRNYNALMEEYDQDGERRGGEEGEEGTRNRALVWERQKKES